jgi:hypothetical protein
MSIPWVEVQVLYYHNAEHHKQLKTPFLKNSAQLLMKPYFILRDQLKIRCDYSFQNMENTLMVKVHMRPGEKKVCEVFLQGRKKIM